MTEVAAAVTEAAMAGVIASSAVQTDSSLGNPSTSSAGGAATQGISTGADATDDSTAGLSMHEKASEQVVRQEAGMDADQMAMRIALDVLWTGGGSGAVSEQQSSQLSENAEAPQ